MPDCVESWEGGAGCPCHTHSCDCCCQAFQMQCASPLSSPASGQQQQHAGPPATAPAESTASSGSDSDGGHEMSSRRKRARGEGGSEQAALPGQPRKQQRVAGPPGPPQPAQEQHGSQRAGSRRGVLTLRQPTPAELAWAARVYAERYAQRLQAAGGEVAPLDPRALAILQSQLLCCFVERRMAR